MICSSCGAENRAGRKFCSECGTPFVAACPACGATNEPGEKFCGECGTPLAGAAGAPGSAPGAPGSAAGAAVPARLTPARSFPAPAYAFPAFPAAATAPVAERRLVSVLFADLVGFTNLAEGRDAEETRELLSRYFELARDVIGRYGGVVEKFIGDAVMAVWGAPVAHEDDAERAVRAGLELVDAVRALGPAIAARAGVLTGEAAVTLGATNQGLVAGDLVNTASRLQSVAAPGSVLVGETTQRAASGAIVFEAAGEQDLKGKRAPVPAWRALRVVAEVGGRNRSESLEAPFVGRDDELRLLKDLFHATGRERRARLVSVIGPAGIGKTRLAWEFLKYVDGLVADTWWHQGRSPAYGEGISFWALGEMVRGRAGLSESDDEPTTRAKLAETVRRWIPEPDERRWVESALLALLGVESAPGSPEELFGAWRTFFERIAAHGTVALVFEDLHYADPGLLDFIDHLLEWSKGLPIYVLTLARPELLERRPDWHAKRSFASVYLEPLPEGAMRALLAGLVPGLPEGAVRAIVGRAGGIPLYAVETVRMLVAEGRLALADGVYATVGDLTSLAVPETLTALIASRLDALPAEDRALVSDAAVLGQSFTPAALAAVSGGELAALEPRLRALVRRELLTLDADPRSPERGQYAFVQALIREVAYNTLAHRDRKVRHLAAARFFEGLGSEELAGALAGHYLAAHQNAPEGPEADALAGQARIALRAAAERAAALGAPEQAGTFLAQALTVTTDPAERAELLERAGEAATAVARHDAAEGFLSNAIALHRERGDRPAAARATAALGRALLSAYHTDQALALLEPAAAEFADLDADPGRIALDGQLARTFFFREDNRRAIEVADRALEAAEHADLVGIVADTLVTRGSALTNLGRSYEGLGALKAGLELAEAHDLPRTALRARINLGGFEGQLHDPSAGLATYRAGLAEARRLGDRGLVEGFVVNAAETAFSTGDWAWASSELEALLATELDREDRLQVLAVDVALRAWRGEPIADALVELDRLVAGLTDIAFTTSLRSARAAAALATGELGTARADALVVARTSSLNAPTQYPAAARAALWSGDATGAAADLAELDATGAHGRLVDLRRITIRAGLAALEGRVADALALYRDALRGLRDMGLPWEEALVAVDMAALLDPAEPAVREAAEAAREILARLGARPFLERLQAAMARSGPTVARPGASQATGEPAARA